jgi:hypothetical protein
LKHLAILLTGLVLLLGSGCAPILEQSSERQQMTPLFRPPALPTQPAPTLSAAQAISEGLDAAAQPDANCEDNLTFRADITIPDGMEVTGLATMDKRWEVENTGTCSWGSGYRVRLIAGPEMNAQKEQALYPARAGTRATIRILFQAPAEAGPYRSAWQAFNAQGEPFGDPFFIDIAVPAP